MISILMLLGGGAVLVVLGGGIVVLKRRPRKLNTTRFQKKWNEMQKMLSRKEAWGEAITQADKLLDEALKKKRFGGKTMGERLTKAQRLLSDNESVWYGHKLRNKLEGDPKLKLKEADVKQALIGIRRALKDLGALTDGK